MDGVKVFDKYGQEQDWAWLMQEFGPVEIWTAPEEGAYWAVAELHEIDDIPPGNRTAGPAWTINAPAVLVARVYGVLGNPASGVLVARRWPYTDPNPELQELPVALQTHFETGVYGQTNENGDIGFGMGGGDFYFPPNVGASSLWVAGNSELVYGLGMVGGTNHRHLNVVFRWCDEEPPGPGPKDLIKQAIDLLVEAVSQMPDVDESPF